MTYAFVQLLPGYSAEKYDAVAAHLGPGPFPGLLVHLAGPCEGGWRIIQVWDSLEDYLRHERGPLAAALDASGAFAGGETSYEELVVTHMLVGHT
jgi:hypothetical protein